MKQKYDIDSLIKTFSEHAEKHQIWLEESPTQKDWVMLDDFNLSTALLSIVKEIKNLKQEARNDNK